MGQGAGGAAGRAGRGAGLLGLLGLLGVLGGRAAPRGARGMGLVLPLYNHKFDSDWAAVADAAGRVPLIAVVAAAPSQEPSAELARNAQALRDAGATVLWYVYTRNGSVPCCECCEDLATIEGHIDNVLQYPGDGIFLDNVAGQDRGKDPAGNLRKYGEIVAAVRARSPGARIMLNGPGHRPAPELQRGYDALMGPDGFPSVWMESYEDNFRERWAQWDAPWLHAGPPSRWTAILHGRGAAASNLYEDVAAAKERGIGWIDHTDTPYQGLATYFEELVAAVEAANNSDDW